MFKNADEKKYGVIYARFSDGPNQTNQSIEGQIRDNEKYAAEHDITIIEYYIDRHISGKNFDNRGEFQRMLQDSSNGKFSYIIVWKTDRFGRNRQEIAINKFKFKKNGVTVLSAMEPIPDGPEGILLESLYEGMAEYYSADLSQKVSRGMRESALKGKVMGTVAYGFRKDEDNCYSLDETTAPIIKEAFNRYYNGETAPDICNDFARRGILRNGKPIMPKYLYYAFRNRKYIGEYSYGDVTINIPPLISREVFDGVQLRLSENSKHYQKYAATVDYLLSGKLVCGVCGYEYVGESGTGYNGTKYYYYKCHGRKSRKKSFCSSRTFKKEFLENFVIEHTIHDVLSERVIYFIAESIMSLYKKTSTSYALKSLYAQKKDTEKSLQNLMKAIEAGIITPSTKERLLYLEEQKESLTLSIVCEESKQSQLSMEHILFWLEQFKDGNAKSIPFCHTLINSFINKCFVYDNKIVIVYNFANNDHSVTIENYSVVRTNSQQVD